MLNKWNLEDILDLNYFSQLDAKMETQDHLLHQRDRHYLLEAEGDDSLSSATTDKCLKLWLARRRDEEFGDNTSFQPGHRVDETQSLFRLILMVVGFCLGAVLGLSYFVYSGKTPLNVFQFLTVFVVPQLLILLLLVLKSFFAILREKGASKSSRLLFSLFTRFFYSLKKSALKNIDPHKRDCIAAMVDKEHSHLFFWPLFRISQLFGICLNLGILCITMLKIATTDLAFGWQSTLQLGPEKLYSLVKLVALPWSWLLTAEMSYPSLMQIEGSRIILKDGIFHLLTENLTSWWPFLLLCLLFYGLLPRIILLLMGLFMEQRTIITTLRKNRYEIICKRMLTPLVSSQAPPQSAQQNSNSTLQQKNKAQPLPGHKVVQPALVLIPDEIIDNCGIETLQQSLSQYNFTAVEQKRIFKDYDHDAALLEDISQMDWRKSQAIVILIEAWMVPIEEHTRFLQSVSEAVHKDINIGIIFLGRPQQSNLFTPPQVHETQMWLKKLPRLHNRVTFLHAHETVIKDDQPTS